ncbi:uncharacterized protein K452DRAFT_293743 [Aplosporella prunicola CBS 121167]|uniref:rRNA methyltransferase 2, mitochondrial n=1 Tax=Aplosporella prunicola CBS 121167 TaxID=1176127 RepID=A0A6A6BT80_9PEZI|nr:uncharacterized protein K452DRAFT_293743 [Aplosporella prunicola CBS 121167]KAF2147296.1 hypothetical protein K452DRAFT_293743 [Aplosporella prunicola CBS 121167]
MLSLRFIRQLADSALLDRPVIASQCRRHSTRALSVARPRTSSTPSSLTLSPSPSPSIAPPAPLAHLARYASSSSSTQWTTRQRNDPFAREARVRGLKSRAAFKLLAMDGRYRLFRRGNTVVDLGYAPGSWSQVAANRTAPGGRVVGIDVIPAQPPRGVSTIQGNFLSPEVQAEVRAYVQDPERGRPVVRHSLVPGEEGEEEEDGGEEDAGDEGQGEGLDGGIAGAPLQQQQQQQHHHHHGLTPEELETQERGYIDRERHASLIAQGTSDNNNNNNETTETTSTASAAAAAAAATTEAPEPAKPLSQRERDERAGRVVDVVLSDMSEPWEQTSGYHKRSVSDPYHRMMNTSGIAFRDHAGSMDLCNAALSFAYDTLRTNGHFVCKFYQGAEDKALELRLRRLFEKVIREKPESSRSESKETYFVALRRKADAEREDVFRE